MGRGACGGGSARCGKLGDDCPCCGPDTKSVVGSLVLAALTPASSLANCMIPAGIKGKFQSWWRQSHKLCHRRKLVKAVLLRCSQCDQDGGTWHGSVTGGRPQRDSSTGVGLTTSCSSDKNFPLFG